MTKINYILFILVSYVAPVTCATLLSFSFSGESFWTILLIRFEIFILAYFLVNEITVKFMFGKSVFDKGGPYLEKYATEIIVFISSKKSLFAIWLMSAFVAFSVPVHWATQVIIISIAATIERLISKISCYKEAEGDRLPPVQH